MHMFKMTYLEYKTFFFRSNDIKLPRTCTFYDVTGKPLRECIALSTSQTRRFSVNECILQVIIQPQYIKNTKNTNAVDAVT